MANGGKGKIGVTCMYVYNRISNLARMYEAGNNATPQQIMRACNINIKYVEYRAALCSIKRAARPRLARASLVVSVGAWAEMVASKCRVIAFFLRRHHRRRISV